jgi:hypothetical protein
MFVSGMGFFTDAYDLFVIGIVVSLLKTQWTLSTGQVSWLNSATLLASAFGAVIFGRIADMLGRKRIYGYEVLILAAGAIASAFAPNYTFLLVSRIVLGIGIGGDYPVSATIMSEYSGKQSRGKMVGYIVAILLIDRVGRRTIQLLGFAAMARPCRWSRRRSTRTCWYSASGAGRRSPGCCSARSARGQRRAPTAPSCWSSGPTKPDRPRVTRPGRGR